MARQPHPQTHAARMAGDDIKSVIKTFSDGPMFMVDHVDPRTKAKHDRIAASPEAQDRVARGLPTDYADRVAQALKGSH